ncbi:MAG: acetolactate synthase small subunit [Candidatus Dormibacteria bacterium]
MSHPNRLLAVLVENRPGVLNRVASHVRARGFNIESLTVGPTEDPGISRMTVALHVGSHVAEQAVKQLYKLVDVIKVSDITDDRIVSRELLLVKVGATPSQRPRVLELVELFRAGVVDVSAESMIIELCGDEEKVSAFIELVRPYGIRETARTGATAMARGPLAVALREPARVGAANGHAPAVSAGRAAISAMGDL